MRVQGKCHRVNGGIVLAPGRIVTDLRMRVSLDGDGRVGLVDAIRNDRVARSSG